MSAWTKTFFFGMFYFSFNFIITHKIFLLFYNIKILIGRTSLLTTVLWGKDL